MVEGYKLQVFLARHAESEGNIPRPEIPGSGPEEERARHDPDLTPFGMRQAKLLAKRLSGERFDAVFSSPLIRAARTARAVAAAQPGGKVDITFLRELREAGTPWSYIGLDSRELGRLCGGYGGELLSLRPDADWEAFETADRDAAYLERAYVCARFFRDTFAAGERIFIVAHGTFNTFLIRALLELTNEQDFNFCQENTGLTKVKYFIGSGRRLSYANDTSHLYATAPGLTFTL
ncbi:MAG: Phosphoserine phosphatase 1 [Firmicutes bacterium ADurb.Bin262]|nr:MAG: Phosphoserine phosphatase 1 [Firmicutes bacterium ADurb.Bin262]